MSEAQKATVHNHTELPARPDLIRLIIGIFGIGSSGPLIALSAMPVPTLIFWRNLGGSLMTLPFALRHKLDRTGVKWAVLAGIVLAVHFVGFFLSMRMTSVTAGTAIVATQPIFAAFFVKLTGGHIPTKAWLGMLISFIGVVVVTGIDLTTRPQIISWRPCSVDFRSACCRLHVDWFTCSANACNHVLYDYLLFCLRNDGTSHGTLIRI